MSLAIVVILVLMISVGVNVFLFMKLSGKKPNPNHTVRTTILEGIEKVKELATIRRRFQSIVSFSEGVKIPGLNMNFPGTTRKFMMKYDGVIVCGCDLSQVKISESYDGGKVKIMLPHSKILDSYADMNSFEVFDQSAGIFTSVKLEDQNREIKSDIDKVKETELQNGILLQADENVKNILSSVVAPTGMLPEFIFTENTPELDANNSPLQLEASSTTEK
ncbi:MAG: DUF4230 domain-containing protein [Synergistaceae bacterium]|nr:DUF4230 domain-containing protein [Synergistaceae bacterium]